MPRKTKLDLMIDQAVNLKRKLRRLEEHRKLSAESFFDHACELAECVAADVDDFQEALDTAVGADSVRSFVRRMMKAFKGDNFPTAHPNMSKMLKAFGAVEVIGELAQLDNTPLAMAQALAAKLATERFPERFGEIDDWSKYEKKTADLRNSLAKIAEKMKSVVKGDDLDFDSSHETLMPDERKRGLCRVSFRRAPGIVLADQDWPVRLIEDCEAAVPAKSPQSKRVRLAEDVSASATG